MTALNFLQPLTRSHAAGSFRMRILAMFMVGLLSLGTAQAKCKSGGLWTFPSGKTVMQNSIFVLDGFARSQSIIQGLNKQHNIYLKSGNKKIKLIVLETLVGQYYITQAVLKPETELEAGLTYTMHIDNLPGYESLEKYNYISQKYEPVSYRVVAGKDTDAPQLSSAPKELGKSFVQYGCGPAIHVIFSNPASDSPDVMVRTTVKNLTTGKVTAYYIQPDGGKINVGHGMCLGAFKFDNGSDYEVDFSFMDASGNSTVGLKEPIKFTKPTELTDDE